MYLTALETMAGMMLILAIGFALTKIKIVDRRFSGQLSRVMYYAIVPAMILSTCTMPYSPERFREGIRMIGLGALTVLTLFGVGTAAYLITGRTVHSRLFRFGIMCKNTNLMGYPLVSALFGEYGLFLFSLLILPMGTRMA